VTEPIGGRIFAAWGSVAADRRTKEHTGARQDATAHVLGTWGHVGAAVGRPEGSSAATLLLPTSPSASASVYTAHGLRKFGSSLLREISVGVNNTARACCKLKPLLYSIN